ncbi:MAG: hypothetical protein QM736_24655 [Vicinamibacterales bacterium]
MIIDASDHLFDGKVSEVADAVEELLGDWTGTMSGGMNAMNDAVIVSAVRTAAGKAPNGTLRGTRPDELAAAVIAEAIRRAPGLAAADIDDVILGCAMPEAEQGMNVARIASLRAGVPVTASAVTVNRFCSSGLQAIAYAAERIMVGGSAAIVAGGTESMSMIPMGGLKDRAESGADGQLSGRVSRVQVSSPRTTRATTASRVRIRTRSRCAVTSVRSPRSTRGDSPTRSCR